MFTTFYNSISTLTIFVASKYAEVFIRKINTSIYCMKNKMTGLIEDKRKDKMQREHTHWNPKKAHATGKL